MNINLDPMLKNNNLDLNFMEVLLSMFFFSPFSVFRELFLCFYGPGVLIPKR